MDDGAGKHLGPFGMACRSGHRNIQKPLRIQEHLVDIPGFEFPPFEFLFPQSLICPGQRSEAFPLRHTRSERDGGQFPTSKGRIDTLAGQGIHHTARITDDHHIIDSPSHRALTPPTPRPSSMRSFTSQAIRTVIFR